MVPHNTQNFRAHVGCLVITDQGNETCTPISEKHSGSAHNLKEVVLHTLAI